MLARVKMDWVSQRRRRRRRGRTTGLPEKRGLSAVGPKKLGHGVPLFLTLVPMGAFGGSLHLCEPSDLYSLVSLSLSFRLSLSLSLSVGQGRTFFLFSFFSFRRPFLVEAAEVYGHFSAPREAKTRLFPVRERRRERRVEGEREVIIFVLATKNKGVVSFLQFMHEGFSFKCDFFKNK
jgi:hypothetical protein